MEMIETKDLTEGQKRKVLDLWNQEYPERLKYADLGEFNEYLENLTHKKHYLLTNPENGIDGWVFLFERENEIWFAIILDCRIQGQGIGTKLLKKIQANEDKLNGWVIDKSSDRKCDGQIYKSPLNFYLKNNFSIIPEQRLETDKISAVKIVWTGK